MRWIAVLLGGLILCGCLSAVVFDVMYVRPLLAHINSSIAAAALGEQRPPSAVADMIHRAHDSRLKFLVARKALIESPDSLEGKGQFGWHVMVLSTALLLPLHLSERELMAAYLSRAYMGDDVQGFAAASVRYLGVPLENVTPEQAAKLFAIAHAPSAYLANPERLERRTQYLLSLPPQ